MKSDAYCLVGIYYRENYCCGAYEKFGPRACSSHYIQIKILNQIVLADILFKMSMVSLDEKAAREEFLKHSEQISSRDNNGK